MPTGFQFGAFELDLSAKELRKRGIRLRVGDQSIEFLIMLLERPGEVVAREEIRKRLWPDGTTVDFEHSINSAVKRLRDALGDLSASPRFVETLPRRGYRFVGSATPIEIAPGQSRIRQPDGDAQELQSATEPAKNAGEATPARLSRSWLYASPIAILLIVVTGIGLWKLQSHEHAPRIGSIAVLPLSNFTGDPEQQFLADGLTEEFITELAQIPTVNVISRTSVSRYKDVKKPVRDIGRELNVDAVLESSLARSGNRIRITAQLIHCASDRHLWARRFDRDLQDVLGVQEDVARVIASEVRGHLAAPEAALAAGSRPANAGAYEAWLRALFFLNAPQGEDYPRGVEHLERAVQLDPGYALAWARLAHVRAARDFGQDLPPSEGFLAALKKANELGQSVAEAHMVNGDYELFWNWDFVRGEAEFRRAAELNPGVAEVRRHLGYCYWILGRKTEALPEMERGRELDPSAFQSNVVLAELLMVLGRNEQAIRQFERTIVFFPRSARPYLGLAKVYRNMGKPGDAAQNLLKCATLEGESAESVAALDRAFRTGGVQKLWRDFHRLRIERLQQRSLKARVSPLQFAEEYAGAGNTEQALAWLNRAYRERCPHLPWIGEVEVFTGMRSDPRFQDILHRIRRSGSERPRTAN